MESNKIFTNFDANSDDNVHAMERMVANMTVNTRAAEDVAFGRLCAGDAAPVDRYLTAAGLGRLAPLSDEDADGYIIENGKIAEYDLSEIYFDIYRTNIDVIFDDAAHGENAGDEIDICRYADGLYRYLKAQFGTFVEIMETSVKANGKASEFDAVAESLESIRRLVSAVGQGKLAAGADASAYIDDKAARYVQSLIDAKNGKLTVKTADIDSPDYKLALFSCFKLAEAQNAALFAAKLAQWHARNAK